MCEKRPSGRFLSGAGRHRASSTSLPERISGLWVFRFRTPTSKFLNWSKLAQAGDSEHHRPRRPGRRAASRSRCRPPRVASVPDQFRPGPCSSSVAAKFVRRLADQIGLGDPWERSRRGCRCRLPSAGRRRSSRCASKLVSALRRGVGIGRLGIVDEEDAGPAADLLHAVRQGRGKLASAGGDRRSSARPSEAHGPRLPRRRSAALCSPRSEPMPASDGERGRIAPSSAT